MSTITKQWLQQKIAEMEAARDEIPFGLDEDDSNTLAAMKLALASLEAEPYGYVHKAVYEQAGSCGLSSDHDSSTHVAVYTAPPAPANAEPVAWLWSHRKHPSEVTLVRPEDDERAEGAHWSGWSCQALYAAPPVPVSVPDAYVRDGRGRMMLNGRQEPRIGYSAGWNACRNAMLNGAENVNSRCTIQTAPALDSSPKIAESPSGNSPVIPDGWVMVPVEPTEDMIVNGFESEPDESFSDDKEWETYEAMSGCQQAAHRAKLCWSAMITAAPKPDVR
ncbi:hypothetical protein [Enterobacter roggenkampii]|uniref:hypothetical protein n=1 Tax=Enterobacter roggenkampii TaxID=1812935 RepID=UPI001C6FE10E|nr:hypothetical protein [Enterobacter roggenkampii]